MILRETLCRMAYALTLLGLVVFAQSSDLDLERWGSPNWEDAGGFLHPIALIAHVSLLWSKQVYRRIVSQEKQQSPPDTNAEVTDTAPATPVKERSVPEQAGAIDDDDVVKRQSYRMRLAAEGKLQEGESHPHHPHPHTVRGQQWRRAAHRLALSCIVFSVLLQLLASERPGISIGVSAIAALLLTINTPAPFAGAPPAVVQQALGWTLFVTSLAAQSVLFYNFKEWIEYDLIACLVRAFGLVILLQGVRAPPIVIREAKTPDSDRSPLVFSPRRRKKTEEEAGLDLRELDDLISKARRSVVITVLKESRARLLNDVRKRRIGGVLLGLGCIVLAHATFFLGAFVDKNRAHHPTWTNSFFVTEISLGLLSAFLIHAVLGKLLWSPMYRFYQPFRGGVYHVVLQAIGWPLVISAALAQLVALNYGICKIELDGLLSGIALTSYAGQIVLLASLARFDEHAPHLGFAFDLEGKELGWIFSVGALILFLGVDILIVRFGLQDTSLVAPVIVCAWVAVALSVPFAYFLERGAGEARQSRFGILRVVALAIWTFSLFLALFLVGRAATLSSQATWLSSKTGFASVIAQGMMTISSEPARGMFLLQQILILASTLGFLWIVMPFVRAFLDVPMWYYAYFFKYWKHTLSPDGRQPLENALIHRNIKYGEDFMDVLVPLVLPSATSTKTDGENEDCGCDEQHPPVVYMHGGGHLFVKRELLSHSMTPLCRAGVVVYTVEYPLSPESKFPHAIICVLQALSWITRHHCSNGSCLAGGKPRVCSECATSSGSWNVPNDYPCKCCPHRRGASVVQLLGDSAGGNLAAMVTALLCNEHLLKALAPHAGYDDFLDWKLPKVQRLGAIYGLLGRKLTTEEEDKCECEQLRSTSSWMEWLARKSGETTLNFVLHHYTGGSIALEGKVVLMDLEGQLRDFAPETLMLCGTADPLLTTNRHALKLIREQTRRECQLVEYEGSIHSFHGMPVQWTFGRWQKDAYPATRELVRFFTGGSYVMPEVDFKGLPRDYSPLIVFPLTMVVIAFFLRAVWYVVWVSASLAYEPFQ